MQIGREEVDHSCLPAAASQRGGILVVGVGIGSSDEVSGRWWRRRGRL